MVLNQVGLRFPPEVVLVEECQDSPSKVTLQRSTKRSGRRWVGHQDRLHHHKPPRHHHLHLEKSDLTKGLLDFGQFATWFGFEPGALSAEQKQHLKTVHQNYQRLSQEEQAIVRQKHQEHQQRKQMIAQEDARRHQQEEAAQSQVAMPSGPKKGAQGGKKTATPVQRMQDKRKQLGGPGDVN